MVRPLVGVGVRPDTLTHWRIALVLLLSTPAAAQVVARVPPVTLPSAPALLAPSFSAAALNPAFAAPSLTPAPLFVQAVPAALRPVRAAPATPERRDPLRQLRRVLVDWVKPGVASDLVDAAPARPGVTAFVLDLDGNAFGPGMPTKIILFKKGGADELPVSTYDFARIEKRIGADHAYAGANLKDYELRGDASFREFFGPKFAADLKWAIENLPESLWQGPSWHALVKALRDPRTAERFYVLTARQHSPEHLLDGFRVLQDKGYIRFLPKLENLHGVGGSHLTAERKAELMAEILDAIEATPPSPDGARPAAGFSDDTWANHEKMRDALLAAIRARPARWTRVKIVLFYTGIGDVAHPPEAIVLNPDGTIRPYIPGEPR